MTPPRSTSHERRRRIAARLLAAAAVVAVAVTSLISSSGDGDGATGSATGTPVPTVEITRFDGSSATLSDYVGRPLVVNFWASWCPSCVAEMSAAFRPVQQSLGDRVDFLGVNVQDERAAALRLVEVTGVLFELAEDPRGDLFTALGGLGMPFTVFIDPAGSVIHSHNGPVTETQLADLIEEFLLS